MRGKSINFIMVGIVLFFVVSIAHSEDKKYLLVEEQLAKVYKDLDPKSDLIKQVKKGEYLELLYDGTSWHKVMVDGKVGWIERKAGKIVEKRGGIPIFGIILFAIVAGGTIGYSIYLIKKQKAPSMVEVDEV
ncbi:MAG: hypothetical protein N2053_10745 [Chitinispirillaceae bacterium]|nr:hypothetical protein [Chitinispirillaceae bacterium]